MSPIRKLCWNYGRGGLKTGKSGFDISGLKKLQKELEKLKEKAEPFAEECTKELGARVLAKVIKHTPVGDYQKDNELMRYKRSNAKKGVKAGDVMLTKSGKARREKYKLVSFKTSKGESVTFRADTSEKKAARCGAGGLRIPIQKRKAAAKETPRNTPLHFRSKKRETSSLWI